MIDLGAFQEMLERFFSHFYYDNVLSILLEVCHENVM